jgi:ribosomal protein L11 methyltransferase
MPWRRLKLTAAGSQADAIAELLDAHGAVAITTADAGDQPLFHTPGADSGLWDRVVVTGLFPADTSVDTVARSIEEALAAPVGLRWEVDELADQDWERSWMDRFEPMRFGRRLWVCPSWHEPPEPDAINIIMDPGLAFGTGTHATTSLCLEWLEEHPPRGLEVIDYGCGSGILAIAALKLGARRATGVDIDLRAVEVSLENAARNDVADRFEGLPPDGLDAHASCDLLIANILAHTLTRLAPRLKALVRPGGRVLLSGILADQVDEVRACYTDAFVFDVRLREDWALLVGTRAAV